MLGRLQAALPQVTDWVGTAGSGLLVSGVEYLNEPALAIMLLNIPRKHYRVFNGLYPLPRHNTNTATTKFEAQTALVHIDARTPEIQDLIPELATRTQSGQIFGGIASHAENGDSIQIAHAGHVIPAPSAAIFHGGFSGVGFDKQVGLIIRVTQGCMPVSGSHTITQTEGPVILRLDDQPALAVMLQDLSLDLNQRHIAIPKLRKTLVGLSHQSPHTRQIKELNADVRIRHLIGLDIERQGIAIAAAPQAGEYLQFCERQTFAAQTDLVRMCTDIRESVESLHADDPRATRAHIRGAIYISCTGRGGPYFGAPHAESQLIRRALGDVPMIGFFAGGEIAGQQLYAYSGVLAVFLNPPFTS
jgi:small ligand-binding sensory domain FIST